jgi:hypothetical protein
MAVFEPRYQHIEVVCFSLIVSFKGDVPSKLLIFLLLSHQFIFLAVHFMSKSPFKFVVPEAIFVDLRSAPSIS